ncbi:Bacterial transglutaminase-like cysteine proteinase BTLCP [compost metagenome]|uniref:Predicted transglutaminase-like cysteine proteinase n=1 Tax=Pseudomonas jinjuensis TaxID=198616 RepID=A0A1H0I833_9PSED|nr:transglutaminase-like cysteine peptidase [Pseudomonas jinjuensis]SDO27568.1 Predicted transglutaminase-like cysteine proteinase [Pseudomonas jinjuensis]
MQPLQGACRLYPAPPRAWAALLLPLFLAAFGGVLANWKFDEILARAERTYGNLGDARQRIADWGRLLDASRDLDESARLQAVNAFFNRSLLFASDRQVWGQEEYWATPLETLYKGAGDCEDYSIAKYVTLRQLGVSSDRLRITYVKALRQNQAHMVLAYYPTPSADPLVLDNLDPEIRPASQRSDLLPVYAFNTEGVWLPGPGGGRRSGNSKQLSRWQDLLAHMRAEGLPLEQAR